jgi:hypothetical protein
MVLRTIKLTYQSRRREYIAARAAAEQSIADKDDALENLTDAMKSDIRDAREFLTIASQTPIVPQVEEFQLEQANEALISLKHAKIRAAAVLRVGK